MNRKERRQQAKLNKKKEGGAPPPVSQHLITMLEQAIGHQNAGRLNEAEEIYKKVLLLDPKNTFANHLLGIIRLHHGDGENAVKHIETAMRYEPSNPEMLKNLSSALMATERSEEAEQHLRSALKLKPDYPEALNNLSIILCGTGRFVEAEQYCRRATELIPTYAFAHNNLGNALEGQDRLEDAESSFRQALELNRDFPEALNGLGAVLMRQGKLDQAKFSFQRALELRPQDDDALNNMGNFFMADGNSAEAERHYRKAVEIAPANVEALNNLGIALHHLEKIEEAEECYRRALEIRPGYVNALKNLANAQMSAGFLKEAEQSYDEAIRLEPQNTGTKVNRAMLLPIIPSSVEEIDTYRARLLENVEALIASGGSIGEPDKEAGVTGFYLAYHNKNDVPIVSKITEMNRKLCPSLTWQAEHCGRKQDEGEAAKFRIGFLSAHFHDHTIGKLYRGLIAHLDREKFEVILFRSSRRLDAMAEAIEQSVDKVVYLQQNLENARHAVANEELDLLYYPDIGMDAFTYYLAYARLAPVQVTSWGHPMSTGIPNIDYYVSSKALETEQGQNHYTETLVRLKHPPTYYYPTEIPEVIDMQAAHGLPVDANLYLCPQTLFKFHPKFDPILGDILRGDPKGLLVLIQGRYKNKEKLLVERFEKAFGDVADRVHFLPRMKMVDFLRVIRASDVILDPVYFGGGNSSAEAIAMGKPIVTWPDRFLRDRVTYAFYRTMGIDELVAKNADDYVRLANKLATDDNFHGQMSKLIQERSGEFFENSETVRELEKFLIAAIEAQRNGDGPVQWGV